MHTHLKTVLLTAVMVHAHSKFFVSFAVLYFISTSVNRSSFEMGGFKQLVAPILYSDHSYLHVPHILLLGVVWILKIYTRQPILHTAGGNDLDSQVT